MWLPPSSCLSLPPECAILPNETLMTTTEPKPISHPIYLSTLRFSVRISENYSNLLLTFSLLSRSLTLTIHFFTDIYCRNWHIPFFCPWNSLNHRSFQFTLSCHYSFTLPFLYFLVITHTSISPWQSTISYIS